MRPHFVRAWRDVVRDVFHLSPAHASQLGSTREFVMRKSTSALRRELAAAEAADDNLANKLTALLTFLDSAERSRMERDDALRAAISEDQAAFLAEIKAMKQEIGAAVHELRGSPVVVNNDTTVTSIESKKRRDVAAQG
jgi:DNA anti-recombination protein RmuC